MTNQTPKWHPSKVTRGNGEERRVGIEIELAGLDAITMVRCVQNFFGGEVKELNRFAYSIEGTELGDFTIELDTQYLKDIQEESRDESVNSVVSAIEDFSLDVLLKAAEQVVPWEIVSPPIKISDLARYNDLVKTLRDAGALGTRHAIHYAFGLHLNPELPDNDTLTILNYMRAFCCLYEWIAHKDKIDFARKLSPFVTHFDDDYVQRIIDPLYLPDMGELIDDYIDANPTRNRSLDMLPLFKHLDAARVVSRMDDPRIKSRPTLHYRLPNSDIDNPDWDLHAPWRLWLAVEQLASSPQALINLCEQYQLELRRSTRIFDHDWLNVCEQYITDI